MASISPLYNVKIQGTLNLNDQALLNNNNAKVFPTKVIGASNKTLDATDMGKLLKFTGSRTLTVPVSLSGVVEGDNFLFTSDGTMTVQQSGGATLINGGIDTNPNATTQVIYIGSNIWLLMNTN
jgi:hypothetical protein